MALLALAAAVPGLVVERRLARAQADLAFTLSPHDRRKLFYGNLQTDERAAKEIRLFGLGGHFLTRMLGEFRTLNDASRRMDRTVLSRQLLVGVLTAALGAVALLIVAGQAADGALGAGDVFVVVAAIAGVQTASSGMVTTTGHLLEAVLLLGHYRDFMAGTRAERAGGRRAVPAAARRDRARRRLVPLLAGASVGAARACRCGSRPARRSRWSGSTAPARARS